MPYEPDPGLRDSVFQPLSLFHIGSRHAMSLIGSPACRTSAHPMALFCPFGAWLLYASQEVGTGPKFGVTGAPGLVPDALRCALSAAAACAAAAAAAASAFACASRWAARDAALARCRSATSSRNQRNPCASDWGVFA